MSAVMKDESSKKRDVTRGTYGNVLRHKAAAVGALDLKPAAEEICVDVPDTSYLAVRNAKRLNQFRERLQNRGTNVVNFHGKVEVRGHQTDLRPDLYVV